MHPMIIAREIPWVEIKEHKVAICSYMKMHRNPIKVNK